MNGVEPATSKRDRLEQLLDAAAAEDKTFTLWWRDDDAVTDTPALQRLVALSARYSLPLGLAVIPKETTAALADRLQDSAYISVLQHGWSHKRHSPDSEKKMELGEHRPLAEILHELRAGLERLAELCPQRFLPVLVPPWNRIGDAVAASRRSVGLPGLSLFGRNASRDPHRVNTHVDITDWTTRGSKPTGELYRLLAAEVERRRGGDPEPIGILTHHLIHAEASWATLDELFGLLADHPAVRWPATPALFALPAPD